MEREGATFETNLSHNKEREQSVSFRFPSLSRVSFIRGSIVFCKFSRKCSIKDLGIVGGTPLLKFSLPTSRSTL